MSVLAITGDMNLVILSALTSSVMGTLNTSITLFLKSGSDSKDLSAHLEVCGSDKKDQMAMKRQYNLRGKATHLLAQWLKVPKSLLEVPYSTQIYQGCMLKVVLDSDNGGFVFSPFCTFQGYSFLFFATHSRNNE